MTSVPVISPGASAHSAPHAIPMRVLYQGIAGSFGELAAERCAGGHGTPVGVGSFATALTDLIAGHGERAVIPIWNSAIGDIQSACAVVAAAGERVRAVGDVSIPVRHCLVARPGVKLGDIQAVASHPAALAQCRTWIAKLEFLAIEVGDTAGAARDLSPAGGTSPESRWYAQRSLAPERCGAIASGRAARQYGLRVLAENVQDDPENLTRFLVLEAR